MRSTIHGAFLLLSTTSLLAQGQLVQLVSDIQSPTNNYTFYTQDIETGCKASVRGRPTIASFRDPKAGGMAYDPYGDAVWVSDGQKIRLQHRQTGVSFCDFNATVTSMGMVTGLAYNAAKKHLYQLEVYNNTTGQYYNVRTYDASSCPPKPLSLGCKGVAINGTGATASGLAYDAVRDLLYISTSLSGFGGWINNIEVVKPANPCVSVNTGNAIPVINCGRPGGPITGLAYSAESERLYATTTGTTRILGLTSPTTGTYIDITSTVHNNVCCSHGLGQTFGIAGSAWLPDFEVMSVGKSCLAAGCGSCANLELDIEGGAPVIGNVDLAFVVRNGPASGNAVYYLSPGTCDAQGISLPGLCGAIHPQIAGGFPLPVFGVTMGGSGCTGVATLKTGVPVSSSVMNITMCMQTLVVCAQNSGAGLTNAVQFRVGG